MLQLPLSFHHSQSASVSYSFCLQGVEVYITVWDSDLDEGTFVRYDMIDEFDIVIDQEPGSSPKQFTRPGIRQFNQTLLVKYYYFILCDSLFILLVS